MSETMRLIRVKRTSGDVQAVRLDTAQVLSIVRNLLTERKIMKAADAFLYKNATVDNADEATINLKEILDDDVLQIGNAGEVAPPGTGNGYDQYLQLSNDEKRAILNNVQVFRGITFDKNNWAATADAFTFKPGYLPSPTVPVDSVKTEEYCFSEVVRQFKQQTSAFAKMEISTPFVSAEAEYKWEKAHQTTSKDVTEYLITRQLVNKVHLTMDPDKLEPSISFLQAVRNAVRRGMVLDSYHDLVKVLNTYGYYLAEEFMMGGIIMGSESTTIKEFSQADSEKHEFNVAFSAKYKMFGGGGSGGGSSGSENTIDQNNKYRNMTLRVIGGIPGTDNYNDWAKTLHKANTWRITDVTKFRPTLILLHEHDGTTLTTAMRVIADFHKTPSVANLVPPQLDMTAYHRRLQALTAIDWDPDYQ